MRAGLAYSIVIWAYLIKDRRGLAVIYVLALSIHYSVIIFIIIRITALFLNRKVTKKSIIFLLLGAIGLLYVLNGIRSTLFDIIFSVPK